MIGTKCEITEPIKYEVLSPNIVKRMPVMALQDSTRVAPFGAVSVFRAVSNVEGFVANFSEWNQRRLTVKALNKLSARELEDIGLSRGDVDDMARGYKTQR